MFAHGTRYDDAGSGPAGHPELEEIAALIDGRLSDPRAERLRSHLASCDDCREVFLETIDFLREEAEDEAELPPFDRHRALTPPRAPRFPATRWLPAAGIAAAAALTLGIGLAVFRSSTKPAEFDLAKASQELGGLATVQEAEPRSVLRGGSDSRGQLTEQSFRLGVELFDLQISIEGNQGTNADTAVAKINGLVTYFNPPRKIKDFYLALRTSPPKDLRVLKMRSLDMARRFRAPNVPAVDNLFLDFGMWTEAGRLAVAAKDEHFLTLHDTRGLPLRMLQEASGDLSPEVRQALSAIGSILRKDSLQEADYRALAGHYEDILRSYEGVAGETD